LGQDKAERQPWSIPLLKDKKQRCSSGAEMILRQGQCWKVYFYDNGLRNALINSFNPLSLRADTGVLWENFMVSERFKYLKTHDVWCNRFFWRTTAQQEIDYIEDAEGKLCGYEFKWNSVVKKSFPKTFLNAYPGSNAAFITPESFFEFLGVPAV